LIKSLRENKKYGAKRLPVLKMSPNKNWSLDGLKALIKKFTMTTQVLLMSCENASLKRESRWARLSLTLPSDSGIVD